MHNRTDATQSLASDRLSDSVLEWLGRTYEAMQDWKAKARDVFYSSNGDSNLPRNRVASIVRAHFLESPPKSEDVERWKAGLEEIETIRVTPPKVSASNSAYVEWLYIADYLLLACASPTERLDEENKRRETEFKNVMGSYNIRLIVYDAREELQRNPTLTDEDVFAAVQKKHPKAFMANIKEARRLEKTDAFHDVPKKPIRAEPMRRYTALYF